MEAAGSSAMSQTLFEKIVARAVSAPDVWVATRLEIADFMLAKNAT